MIPPALEQKCLTAAIQQLRAAKTRGKANGVYISWPCFKTHPEFLKEIELKKKEFLNKKV